MIGSIKEVGCAKVDEGLDKVDLKYGLKVLT